MSFENITLIILFSSLLGLLILVLRKIPALAELPQEILDNPEGHTSKTLDRIKSLPVIKIFLSDIFLQKIISQIRVLTLKADHKTANWLKALRQKTQKKKLEDKNYWEEIKNSTDIKK